MLTGDVSSAVEIEVMNNYDAQLLDVDLLKIAHHGSSSGTSLDFLTTTSPDYAVISVAEFNSYGHPSSVVYNNIDQYCLETGSDLKDNVMLTSTSGNIISYVNPYDEINFITIYNEHGYLFVSWWVVCLCLMAVILVLCLYKGIKIQSKKASNV
jgi:competence protein ComEC